MRPLTSVRVFVPAFLAILVSTAALAKQGLIELYHITAPAPVIASIEVAVDPEIIRENPIVPRSRTPESSWPLAPSEADMLAEALKAEIEKSLKKAGAYDETADSGVTLRAAIISVEPNNLRFTRAGIGSGLNDGSIALGGATMMADMVSADGDVIAVFTYSNYAASLDSSALGTPWNDAKLAFSRFGKALSKSLKRHGIASS